MQKGFIKLHRRVRDHWLYQEKRTFSKFEAWIDLIMRANYEDKKMLLGNELISVKRGQVITSIRKLCECWGWSNTKVNTFLNLLEQDEMITTKSDTKKTVINICNYNVYHENNNGKNDTKTSQEHHEGDTKAHNEEVKRIIKNYKEDTSSSKLKFETHHLQLAKLLFKEMKKNNPEVKEPNFDNWANTFRLMMERDNRQGKEIQDMILFSQQHDFWHKNILSPTSLRKQFDRLTLEKNSGNKTKRRVARF